MKCTNNKPTGIKLFFTLLFLLCTATVVAFIPVPDCAFGSSRSSGLRKVADDWIAGGTTRATVETTYGLIQDWDTSEVTSMSYLFNGGFTSMSFEDADLSKWNVAKVTNMFYSTFQFPLFNSLSTTCFLFFFLSLFARIFIFITD